MQEIEQMRAREKAQRKAPSFDRFLNYEEVNNEGWNSETVFCVIKDVFINFFGT